MKTKLLYLTSIMLVFMTACSVDEHSNELSADEKELKVKNLIAAFSKDIIPSPGYAKFIEEAKIKSSSGLTEEEIQQLEQEFLNQQSAEFVELYYYVIALNLSEEELRDIIIEYVSTINKNFSNEIKNDAEECAISNTEGDDSLWAFIVRVICEAERSDN